MMPYVSLNQSNKHSAIERAGAIHGTGLAVFYDVNFLNLLWCQCSKSLF